MRIAIPSEAPGGLQAKRSEHFGHCDVFTLIDIDISKDNQINEIVTVANEGHKAGGCMTPVTLLQAAQVDAIVVAGLGARPMQAFNQVGIAIYFADNHQLPDVSSVVDGWRQNKLILMHTDQVCSGSAKCHH